MSTPLVYLYFFLGVEKGDGRFGMTPVPAEVEDDAAALEARVEVRRVGEGARSSAA